MEFTYLEAAVLEWMSDHSKLAHLKAQLSTCSVVGREVSSVGSFTELSLPDDVPRLAQTTPISGPWIKTPGEAVPNVGSVLFVNASGVINLLELATCEEPFEALISEFELIAP